MAMTLQELSDNMELVLDAIKVGDAKTLGGLAAAGLNTPSTIPARDVNSDVSLRTIRTSIQSQSEVPQGSSMAFRINNGADNHLRFASKSAIIEWLGKVLDSDKFAGRTLSEVREELRYGLVPDSLTINNHRLDTNFSLNAADVGLGNVPNFAAVSGYDGASTSLLATQKAVFDAASAPKLAPERKRKITIGTLVPTSGMEDGEVFIQI